MRRSFSSALSAMSPLSVGSVCCLLFLSSVVPAAAQIPDAVGVRGQGMGGAFTALADDSSATWWNPAGVAGGAFLNMILEYGTATEAPTNDSFSHLGFSFAFPALAVSYYRMPISEIRLVNSTDGALGGRQDPGTLSV